MLEALKEQVLKANLALPKHDLVTFTWGNVSAIDRESGLIAIKPSGVDYDDLGAGDMILCDLDGNVVEGSRAPSSDTAAHAYVYRNMPHVGGVVHTHSTYATAWAARAEAIPCVLTAMADEFGGDIPVGPFAIIGDDSIGRGIVGTLTGHRSRAVLMRNHGPFTIGRDARLDIQDSPPGVPDEALPRLFDRLFRVDPSRSRVSGGAGLGLAICERIVDSHHGTILAMHSPFGGLLVRITLPLATDADKEPRRPS